MGSQRLPGATSRPNMHWGPATAEAHPAPEDIFIAWLLWLPRDADVVGAAAAEIERIDCGRPLPPGPSRLRELLLQLVEGAGLRQCG